MASQWHYRLFDVEFGPVTFRELVGLVNAGTLTQEDLVRADWQKEWRPAETVVGLFYMARRAEE